MDKNKYMNVEYIDQLFDHFDTSNNGYITI